MTDMAENSSEATSDSTKTNSHSTAGVLLAHQPSYCTSPPIEVVVFGWGVTEDGQLGLDSKEDVKRPSVIESLLGTSFSGFRFNRKPIVAGSRHTLAVTQDGRVLSWGWNDRGTLGLQHRCSTIKPDVIHKLSHEHVVQVAAGGWHCLAVTASGQIYAWGGNEYFQCGVDAGKRDLEVPTPTVPFLKVSMVSCGGMHSVALTTTGDIWQWGEPWGDFSSEVNRSPRKLAASKILSITSGAFHNLALNESNQVLSWGTNDFGQLGTGDTTYTTEPRLTVGLDEVDVADISAGGWHSLALSADGEVYIWGRGEYGRLGLNDPKGVSHMKPCLVPGLKGHRVIQAMCGGSHTMALTDQGRIFTWGRCTGGRQGFDAKETVNIPVQINMPGGSERWHPICIAAGGRHCMCMALPRQTVTDHERRLTAGSDVGSAFSIGSDRSPLKTAPISTAYNHGGNRRPDAAATQYITHSGPMASTMSSTTATGEHQVMYTVPADRDAFVRETTTTDCGDSSSGRRVTTQSSDTFSLEMVPTTLQGFVGENPLTARAPVLGPRVSEELEQRRSEGDTSAPDLQPGIGSSASLDDEGNYSGTPKLGMPLQQLPESVDLQDRLPPSGSSDAFNVGEDS